MQGCGRPNRDGEGSPVHMIELLRLTPSTISIVAPASPSRHRPRPASSSSTSSAATSPDDGSRVIHFLENSCGLPPNVAAAVAKGVHFKTTTKAEAVLALFEQYGFSKSQVAHIVARKPRVLSADPNRTLKTKLDFFRRLKVSNDEVAELITAVPAVLHNSIKTLEPCVEHLMSVLQDEQMVLLAIKRFPGLIRFDLPALLLPNIRNLRRHGVAKPLILMLLCTAPKGLMQPKRPFVEVMDMIKRMGIDPTKLTFTHAFRVLTEFPIPNWEGKLAVFKSLGWSEKQILHAFSKSPYFMAASEEKIRRNMKFFMETLQWGPEKLCKNPAVLGFSIDKRLMPRYLVLKTLASKNMLSDGGEITVRQLMLGNEAFMNKYVIKYKNEIPELLGFMN